MIEWNVGVGELIQIIGILGGGAYAVFAIIGKLNLSVTLREKEHEDNLRKFNKIEEQLDQLTKVIIQLTRQEEKISQLEKRLSELGSSFNELLLEKPPPPKRRSRA